jgi:murein DD-endopeptidase MepM/ murein hydrolase activator NlpD
MDFTTTALSVAAALTSAVTAALPSSPPSGPIEQAGATWPVTPASVVRPYEPTTRYGPGHRGVDLAAEPGDEVRAALPGRVAVAGPVAGRPLVVLQHRGPMRTTYLPVAPRVEVGDRVSRGQVIGVVATPAHGAGDCLHWGVRVGDDYLDPLSLVRSQRVVLLPDP